MFCRSGGCVPICEVDGVKPIAMAACRGWLPLTPTSGAIVPRFHVTAPLSGLTEMFSLGGEYVAEPAHVGRQVRGQRAFSILLVVLVTVKTSA